MNDKMLDIIGLADENYVREAAEPQRRIKHHRRFSARLVAVVAAAVCLTSVGAFAAYKGIINRDSVGQYYDSSAMDSMESKGYAVGKTVENEHFRLTVESVLVDKHSIRVMLTAKALDKQANAYLRENTSISTDIEECADENKIRYSGLCFENFDYTNFGGYTAPKQYEDGASIAMCLDVPLQDNDSSRTQFIDLNKPLKISFANESWRHKANYDQLFGGLKFTINKPNQAKTVELAADDGTKTSISEFNIFAPYKDKDNSIDPEKTSGIDIKNAKVFFKDGSSLDIMDERNANTIVLTVIKDENGKISGDYEACISLRSLIDPEKVERLEFNGKTYKAK